MNSEAFNELLRDASRYIWWEKPDEAVRRPGRVIAQVMDIGDFDDVCRMVFVLGTGPLLDAIRHAEPGWFSERSWTYWCYRLGIVEPGVTVPPLPRRSFHQHGGLAGHPNG